MKNKQRNRLGSTTKGRAQGQLGVSNQRASKNYAEDDMSPKKHRPIKTAH